jgi:hypothetical protein
VIDCSEGESKEIMSDSEEDKTDLQIEIDPKQVLEEMRGESHFKDNDICLLEYKS